MLTLKDVQRLITEETEKLHKIGIKPLPQRSLTTMKARTTYADCYKSNGMYDIRVSEYFLYAPECEVRGTIMHELLHAVPSAGHGHGKGWKKLADKVNTAYPQYTIKRCGTQLTNGTSFCLRASAAAPSHNLKVIKVVCTECGHEWTRHRESRLTLHPEYYKCICGANLVRV